MLEKSEIIEKTLALIALGIIVIFACIQYRNTQKALRGGNATLTAIIVNSSLNINCRRMKKKIKQADILLKQKLESLPFHKHLWEMSGQRRILLKAENETCSKIHLKAIKRKLMHNVVEHCELDQNNIAILALGPATLIELEPYIEGTKLFKTEIIYDSVIY